MLEIADTILATLPATARARIERLAADRAAARAAYRHASDREQEARNDLGRAEQQAAYHRAAHPGYVIDAREAPDDREARISAPVEAAKRTLESRTEARNRAADRQNAFAFLESVEAWLNRTPAPQGGFKAAKVAAPKSKAPAADAAAIRHRLVEIEETFAMAEAAAVPKADLLAAAHAEIDRAAEAGALSVNPRDRTGSPLGLANRLTLRPHASGNLVGDGGAGLFVALLKDRLKAEAEAAIRALPDAGALSDREREKAFADLAAERLALERSEEMLIEQAEAAGQVIARRTDADPRAVLGIED